MLKMNVYPYIKSPEGLFKLFTNESLIIKKFIYNLEEEMTNELHLSLNNNKNFDFNKDYEKFRNYFLTYLAKLIIYYLEKYNVYKLYLNESNIGFEGACLISSVIKKCKTLKCIDFSNSILTRSDLQMIISAIEDLEVSFSINLTGVSLSLNALKYIKKLEVLDYKKEFITGNNNELNKVSKMTMENNKKTGKFEKKKKKIIEFIE